MISSLENFSARSRRLCCSSLTWNERPLVDGVDDANAARVSLLDALSNCLLNSGLSFRKFILVGRSSGRGDRSSSFGRWRIVEE